MGQKKRVEYHCEECDVLVSLPLHRYKKKVYPTLCGKCGGKRRGDSYKKIRTEDPKKWKRIQIIKRESAKNRHKQRSEKEKSEFGKYMNSKIKTDRREIRAKQQQTIISDPNRYRDYCAKRQQIASEFHKNLTEKEKEEHYRKVFKNRGRSKECDDFMDFLEKHHGIFCDRERYIRGFIVDGVIKNTNIIIEYYGDVFHCNPKKFKDERKKCSWLGGRTVLEQWERDLRRLAALYRYGYRVIIVWSSDWKANQDDILKRIKYEMRKN